MLIGGDAGIGKTTLAERLAAEARARGALVLIGRCYDLAETPPYGPWIELFRHYGPHDALPAPPIAFAHRGTVGVVASQLDLFNQVGEFLIAVTARQPLTLIFDDLHWADPASLDLLRFVGRSMATNPLLILATYRANELTHDHALSTALPALIREVRPARLDIHNLLKSDLHALVDTQYRLDPTNATRLVVYLEQRTEGNPFFLREMLRTLEEEQALHETNGEWHLADLRQIRVPPLLRQVIENRLARLGEHVQEVLAVAAVVGQEVSLTLWSTVSGVDDETLGAMIERAVAAHIVAETPDGTHARFVHALIREALYERILPSRRVRMHRQVAEALIQLPDPDPDAVAYHLQRARDGRALAWLIRSGERAQQAYANRTAGQRYEAAFALMGTDPSLASERGWLLNRLSWVWRNFDPQQGIAYLHEAEREATIANDRVLAAVVRYSRGAARQHYHYPGDSLGDLIAGVEALEALTPAERASLDAHDAVTNWADVNVRGTLVQHLAISGYLAEATAMGERIIATSATSEGRYHSPYGDAFDGLGVAYGMLGRPDDAQRAFARAAAAYQAAEHFLQIGLIGLHELALVVLPYRADQAGERHLLATRAEAAWQQARDGGIDIPPRLAWLPVLLQEAAWDDAWETAQTACTSQIAHMREYAMRYLAELAWNRGMPDLARAQIHGVMTDGAATAPGVVTFDVALALQRIAVALALDAEDLPTARDWLDAHDRWLEWGEAVLGRADGDLLWARYHRRSGDRDRALMHAVQAREPATASHQLLTLLRAHRFLGILHTDDGRCDEATTHLRVALTLADACDAPYERALTLLECAACARATGSLTDAHLALENVRAICLPLKASPALARADMLAAQLATRAPAAVTFPAGLSAREVDVLRLLVEGRTNREIAAILFLSERTIHSHVRNIFAKTRSDNRAAATAFALRHDLA